MVRAIVLAFVISSSANAPRDEELASWQTLHVNRWLARGRRCGRDR